MEKAQENYWIRYKFVFDGGKTADFTVHLHPQLMHNVDPLPDEQPTWTKLDFNRCPNCPLDAKTHPVCPTAAHLAKVVADFAQTFSFTEADIHVSMPERELVRRTSVQMGLMSLLGIYMTTSGCPILAKLRPMVRFHLPFATPVDTMFRAAGAYLIGQFLRSKSGHTPDWTLEGLARTYREIAEVNAAFARRLIVAAPLDAHLNALVLLDVFAKGIPGSIADGLEELRALYDVSWGK